MRKLIYTHLWSVNFFIYFKVITVLAAWQNSSSWHTMYFLKITLTSPSRLHLLKMFRLMSKWPQQYDAEFKMRSMFLAVSLNLVEHPFVFIRLFSHLFSLSLAYIPGICDCTHASTPKTQWYTHTDVYN